MDVKEQVSNDLVKFLMTFREPQRGQEMESLERSLEEAQMLGYSLPPKHQVKAWCRALIMDNPDLRLRRGHLQVIPNAESGQQIGEGLSVP